MSQCSFPQVLKAPRSSRGNLDKAVARQTNHFDGGGIIFKCLSPYNDTYRPTKVFKKTFTEVSPPDAEDYRIFPGRNMMTLINVR